MHLRSLYLRNFRAYAEKRFDFIPGVNVIRGCNARGKTSILEAIHILMTGRSFRTHKIANLVRHGASSFYIEVVFIKHGVEQTLAMSCDGKERKILYNHTLCPTVSGLFGLVQGTLMAPDDIELVKGVPRSRRRFLDLQLAQTDPLYVHHVTRYWRAMRQRNHLLRMKDVSTIESWEQEMAKAAAYIVTQRYRALDSLQSMCQEVQCILSGKEEIVSLAYKAGGFNEKQDLYEMYLSRYEENRPRELQLGNTLTGPHRDDFQIFIGDKEARYFASEGQQRSCVLALRFAEWEYLSQRTEDVPLMLVDDVGINLDQSRRNTLLSLVGNLHQVFLTTTEDLSLEKMEACNVIDLGS